MRVILRRKRNAHPHIYLVRKQVRGCKPRTLRDSAHAYAVLLPLFRYHMSLFEACRIIALDANCSILGIHTHSKGGSSGTIMDPRLLFSALLVCGATKWVIAHNHTNGILQPSSDDLLWTEHLRWASALLALELCDHIILTTEGYFSFRENGLMSP